MRQVLNSIVSYEKSEQVQQANMLKRQTLTFPLSMYRPNSFKHLSINNFLNACCDHCIGSQNNMVTRSFLTNNTVLTISKLFTPDMYCWSRKTLIRMHLRVNGICTKSFCPQKTNNRMLFLTGCFQRQCCYI